MATRDRIRRYRHEGGAADLVRVEVLVPSGSREQVVQLASRLRDAHRQRKGRIVQLCAEALSRYRTRVLDGVDLDRLQGEDQKASVIAKALIERGDARAFALGRQILAELSA